MTSNNSVCTLITLLLNYFVYRAIDIRRQKKEASARQFLKKKDVVNYGSKTLALETSMWFMVRQPATVSGMSSSSLLSMQKAKSTLIR